MWWTTGKESCFKKSVIATTTTWDVNILGKAEGIFNFMSVYRLPYIPLDFPKLCDVLYKSVDGDEKTTTYNCCFTYLNI